MVKFSFDDLTQEESSDIFLVSQNHTYVLQYVIVWKNNPQDSTTCLSYLIWPFECQVTATARALINLNAHFGQCFPFQTKRIQIQLAVLFICKKVNECIPINRCLYNVTIWMTTHNQDNSRRFIFRSSFWQRDIKTCYLLPIIIIIASLLRDMELSSICPRNNYFNIIYNNLIFIFYATITA